MRVGGAVLRPSPRLALYSRRYAQFLNTVPRSLSEDSFLETKTATQ